MIVFSGNPCLFIYLLSVSHPFDLRIQWQLISYIGEGNWNSRSKKVDIYRYVNDVKVGWAKWLINKHYQTILFTSEIHKHHLHTTSQQ